MTTIAQRMRAAADDGHALVMYCASRCEHALAEKVKARNAQLRADADALEAVEREMRVTSDYTRAFLLETADRIRGKIK